MIKAYSSIGISLLTKTFLFNLANKMLVRVLMCMCAERLMITSTYPRLFDKG